MKIKLLFIVLIMSPFIAFSQYEKMLETMENEMETLESGKLVLKLINAETGGPVDSATVKIDGVGTYTSDGRGKVLIDPPADKTYALLFSRRGFISATYNLEVVAGTVFNNHFTVSPVIEFGALRVVLDWGKSPADLDAHLVKESDYHISYQKMHLSTDGTAKLDRDDRQGFGPETITVKSIDNKATYTYFIKNFTNAKSTKSKALSKSGAKVSIYSNNKLVKTYAVKPDKKGTTWVVFTIENGKVVDKDVVGNWY
jgi:hypothetical protein